jgi:hypothetical protein
MRPLFFYGEQCVYKDDSFEGESGSPCYVRHRISNDFKKLY